MCSGRPIQQLGPTGKKLNTWYYPTVADRRWAAEQIGKKCMPDLGAVQLTGEDGGPISTVNATLHIVERISAAFGQVDATADKPLAEQLPDEALRSVMAVNYIQASAEAAKSPQGPADVVSTHNGGSTAVAPPAAPEAPPEVIDVAPEPEAPEVDHTLSFVEHDYSIVGRAPQRAGLPVCYELWKRGALCRSGPFALCLDLMREQVGDDLGEWVQQKPRPTIEPNLARAARPSRTHAPGRLALAK